MTALLLSLLAAIIGFGAGHYFGFYVRRGHSLQYRGMSFNGKRPNIIKIDDKGDRH